jgi:hypothetical protein
MSSVAPPYQTREALQPIRYNPITIQLSTLGDNCNDMLCVMAYNSSDSPSKPLTIRSLTKPRRPDGQRADGHRHARFLTGEAHGNEALGPVFNLAPDTRQGIRKQLALASGEAPGPESADTPRRRMRLDGGSQQPPQ